MSPFPSQGCPLFPVLFPVMVNAHRGAAPFKKLDPNGRKSPCGTAMLWAGRSDPILFFSDPPSPFRTPFRTRRARLRALWTQASRENLEHPFANITMLGRHV